jgi:hypothetical protein
MIEMVIREPVREVDEVKRTTGPQTTNGKRWEVQLNGTPAAQWLQLFKLSRESMLRALPHRVEFDRTSATFKCNEDQVEHWIASIDKWMASTNARYLALLEEVRRQRYDRLDAAVKERVHIEQLNERFKGL